MIKRTIRSKSRGQAIVIIAGALVALIALVALAIDGGNAYAQRRNAQNAVDGAAIAGITKLNEIFADNRYQDCDTHPGVCEWKLYAVSTVQNLEIKTAMLTALQVASTNANTIDTTAISGTVGTMDLRYIDTDGHVYGPRMTDPNVTVPLASGDGAGSPGAAGVWVTTTSSAGTYFARLIGVDHVTADAHAGARIGGASSISPLPQIPNAAGQLNVPILWPIAISSTVPLDTQNDTVLYSNTDPEGERNWVDLKYTSSETNGVGCVGNINDFSCFMSKGFRPNDSTPFQGFAEQGASHNPNLTGPVANHRSIPLGSDGVTAGSTGIWIAGTPGNAVSDARPLGDQYTNLDLMDNAIRMQWPVFLPIYDREIIVSNQHYYHVSDVACFVIRGEDCCGNSDDITGRFRGYGWAAGNGTYSNNLHKAVVDGQTVIQLGP